MIGTCASKVEVTGQKESQPYYEYVCSPSDHRYAPALVGYEAVFSTLVA